MTIMFFLHQEEMVKTSNSTKIITNSQQTLLKKSILATTFSVANHLATEIM